MRRLAGAVALLLAAIAVQGHEVRPAYLELRETAPGEFSVLWKTPMRGDLRLALEPVFSGDLEVIEAPAARTTGSAALQTWRLRAHEPLRSQTVRIVGLEGTMTDALVRIEFADGTGWTQRLTPNLPGARIPEQPTALDVASTYFRLGVEHIVLGVDHLLFVLVLLLACAGTWLLVRTVTAFTVAHSLTLALATLGVVRVPQAPVEALIALSIVFVAAEIVRARYGRPGLAMRSTWLVAFAFGLLHGLGFAGALAEVGLPQGQVPGALLWFNVGVEAGQLAFIAAVLLLSSGIRILANRWPAYTATLPVREAVAVLPPYAIGSVAMFWVIERVAAF